MRTKWPKFDLLVSRSSQGSGSNTSTKYVRQNFVYFRGKRVHSYFEGWRKCITWKNTLHWRSPLWLVFLVFAMLAGCFDVRKKLKFDNIFSNSQRYFRNHWTNRLAQERSQSFRNEGLARELGADWDSKWRLKDPCTKCHFIWKADGGWGLLTEGAQAPSSPLSTTLDLLVFILNAFSCWIKMAIKNGISNYFHVLINFRLHSLHGYMERFNEVFKTKQNKQTNKQTNKQASMQAKTTSSVCTKELDWA